MTAYNSNMSRLMGYPFMRDFEHALLRGQYTTSYPDYFADPSYIAYVQPILEYLNVDLFQMYDYVMVNNAQAEANGYHNNGHTQLLVACILYMCIRINVTGPNTCLLVAAALWHDYHHSGGAQPDSVNIKTAVDAAYDYFNNDPYGQKFASQFGYEEVLQIIEDTQYPYTSPPRSLYAGLFRDMDIASTMTALNFADYVLGLRNELVSNGRCSEAAFNISQYEFLDTLQWNDQVVRMLFEGLRVLRLQQVELILNPDPIPPVNPPAPSPSIDYSLITPGQLDAALNEGDRFDGCNVAKDDFIY